MAVTSTITDQTPLARAAAAAHNRVMFDWMNQARRAAGTDGGNEVMVLLAFDAPCALVGVEVIAGGPSEVRIDFPTYLDRFSRLAARWLVVGHSHPSGDPRPSAADIRATRRIARDARRNGMALIDHVIWTDCGHFSFRAHRLM